MNEKVKEKKRKEGIKGEIYANKKYTKKLVKSKDKRED